ncbi:MAG TPA: hypothetical protein VHE55_15320 [Fimbriimonadaceae bacterium]|nr:hypothetical protein [Fimbriimonadaceae bacterium]
MRVGFSFQIRSSQWWRDWRAWAVQDADIEELARYPNLHDLILSTAKLTKRNPNSSGLTSTSGDAALR